MSKVNEKAVALFKEHLPPHLAEMCIKQHEKSVRVLERYLTHEPKTLADALYNSMLWTRAKSTFATLYTSTDVNYLDLEMFYEKHPELAVPTGASEPEEVTVDVMIDRAAELQASSNAEDTREPMHDAEPPKVSDAVMVGETYKDMHRLHKDVDWRQKQIEKAVIETKAAVWRTDANNADRWDRCLTKLEQTTNVLQAFQVKLESLERTTHEKLDIIKQYTYSISQVQDNQLDQIGKRFDKLQKGRPLTAFDLALLAFIMLMCMGAGAFVYSFFI